MDVFETISLIMQVRKRFECVPTLIHDPGKNFVIRNVRKVDGSKGH